MMKTNVNRFEKKEAVYEKREYFAKNKHNLVQLKIGHGGLENLNPIK